MTNTLDEGLNSLTSDSKGGARGLKNSANFTTGVLFYLSKPDLYRA